MKSPSKKEIIEALTAYGMLIGGAVVLYFLIPFVIGNSVKLLVAGINIISPPSSTSEPAVVSSSSTPSPSPTPSVKPQPTQEQIAKIAYSDECFERVNQTWGYDSPKHEVIGAYVSIGYTREEIDQLSLWDLTKVAALKLNETNNEAATVAEMAKILNGVELAGQIVTNVAHDVYMPKHLQTATEYCADLVGQLPQTPDPASSFKRYATIHTKDSLAHINIREQLSTLSKTYS